MRTIGTDNLESLRPDGVDPWRVGDGLLLRLQSAKLNLTCDA